MSEFMFGFVIGVAIGCLANAVRDIVERGRDD